MEHNPANGLVVSGGWDATVRLWEPRAPLGPGRAVGTLPLPGKVFSMATSGTRLVVATSGRRIHVYDLRSLRAGAAPAQQRESPLKYQARRDAAPACSAPCVALNVSHTGTQTRCVRCLPDDRGYAVASVEGRVAVDYFDDAESAASKYAFKCHRRTEGGKDVVYPVNALGATPACMGRASHSSCADVVIAHSAREKPFIRSLAPLPRAAATDT